MSSYICCGGILLLLWSSFLGLSHGVVTCKTDSNPCRCEFSDGSRIVDLSALNNKGGKAYFQNNPQQGSNDFLFDFNPCSAMTDPYPKARKGGKCEKASVCQYMKPIPGASVEYEYNCGQPNPIKRVVNNQAQFVYTGVDQYSNLIRRTTLTVVCDKSTKGKLSAFSESPPSSGQNTATLKTKHACESGGGGSGTIGGLSIGSILVIVFCVLILVYCVAGILFMKFVKGAESVPEMIPNKPFWASFPGLVKDGCVFFGGKTKACCSFLYGKATGRGYQAV